MTKHAMIILLALAVSFIDTQVYADTICPPVQQLSVQNPPAGWTLLNPALVPGQDYYFSSAIHSLNTTYFYLQIECNYACAPTAANCTPFTLLSNAQYQQPTTN